MERQEEEKEKEKLRNNANQLRIEIEEQESNAQDYKYRLTQVKEGNHVLKEELITLINLEEKLKNELEKAVNSYHNVTALEQQANHKLKLMEDELAVAEEDVRLLTDEYLKETHQLKQQEL